MQIARLFETVYLLLDQRTMKARDLAEHFEVSVRTIYRDVEVLSQAGIPIYTSKGKGGGISLMDHYVLNKSLLTSQEQESILTSLSSMQMMQDKESDAMIQKLGSIFQKAPIDWIEVDFHDWSLHKQQQKFDIIKEAIFSNNLLTFQYVNTQGEEHVRTIEPMKLIFRGQAWYVFGFCELRQEARYFKLSRIQKLQKLDTSFVRRDITITKHEYHSISESLPITLKIHKNMSFRVYDEFSIDECEKFDDYILVHTKMPYQDWTYQYLLSYGDQLEVIEPESIRTILKQMIDHLKNIYL